MSLFYKECQLALKNSLADIDVRLHYLSEELIFKNTTENLTLHTYFNFETKHLNSPGFHYRLERRISELQNSGFEVHRDKDGVNVSAESAIFGFALECRLAFERKEQEIMNRLCRDLPEFSECDLLDRASNGHDNILLNIYIGKISPRILNTIHQKYKFWTDQGFRININRENIELYFQLDFS